MHKHTHARTPTHTHTHTHTLNLCGVSNSICLSALSLILFSSSLSRSLFFYNSSHTEPLLPYSSSSSHPCTPPSLISPLLALSHFLPSFYFSILLLSLRSNLSSLLSLSCPLFFLLHQSLSRVFFFFPLLSHITAAILHAYTFIFSSLYLFHFFLFFSRYPSILTNTCFWHLKILEEKREKRQQKGDGGQCRD